MALSEHEQRLLEEMERSLYHNEADVVSTLGATRRAPNYTAVVSGVVMAVVGLAVMLWAVSSSLTWLGVIGFLVLFAGVMIAVTIPGPVTESSSRASSRSGRSAGSLMDQLNERWDRRRGGESL
jgi:ABC-type multidrug transport system fused ATPase/permease subunit